MSPLRSSIPTLLLISLLLCAVPSAQAQESDQVPMPDDMPQESPEETPPPIPVPVPMPVPVPVPSEPVPEPEPSPPVDMTPPEEREERGKADRQQREERAYREQHRSERDGGLDEARRAQEAHFGAVASPLVLPRGSSSAYGFIGLPELAAGYRHGLGKLELEGRANLNYFWMSLALEGRLRIPVYKKDKWELGVPLGVGMVFSPGATYIDDDAVDYVGLRGILGAMAVYRLTDTVHPIFEFEASNDFVFTSGGVHNASIVAGGGVEVYLARGWSALFSARLGWNGVQDQLEPLKSQAAVQIRLGLGYRLF